MRATVYALLVLGAALAGCVGDQTTVDENVSCNEENSVGERTGSLSPGGSLSAETNHTGVPAQVDINLVTEGTGTIDLVLTRDGTEVWEDEASNTGNGDFSFGTTVQQPGTYTLTASTEDGLYNSVELRLQLSWSEGC